MRSCGGSTITARAIGGSSRAAGSRRCARWSAPCGRRRRSASSTVWGPRASAPRPVPRSTRGCGSSTGSASTGWPTIGTSRSRSCATRPWARCSARLPAPGPSSSRPGERTLAQLGGRRLLSPAAVEEIVSEARAAETIRVAGAGHSFSPLVATDGVLLRLDAMDRILDVRRHADGTASVRVQAGIRLQRLSDELDRHGLALPNLGDIDVQSLAGAVATGTHGTGARLLPLHAQIESIELVDGAGMQRTLDAPGELHAARLALG